MPRRTIDPRFHGHSRISIEVRRVQWKDPSEMACNRSPSTLTSPPGFSIVRADPNRPTSLSMRPDSLENGVKSCSSGPSSSTAFADRRSGQQVEPDSDDGRDQHEQHDQERRKTRWDETSPRRGDSEDERNDQRQKRDHAQQSARRHEDFRRAGLPDRTINSKMAKTAFESMGQTVSGRQFARSDENVSDVSIKCSLPKHRGNSGPPNIPRWQAIASVQIVDLAVRRCDV